MIRRLTRALFPIGRLRREDRWTVFLLWLTGILQGFAQAQVTTTVPFTRVALGLSQGDMSLVLALTRFAGIGAIAFSWWGDRSGRRRPFLLAYAVLILATGSTALVSDPVAFTGLQSVVRLSTAAVGTLGVVLLAERVGANVRAFAISLYGAGGSFGAGLALVALPLADRSPDAWRIPFALGTIGLVLLPLLFRRIEESTIFATENTVGVAPVRELVTSPFRRWFWLSAAAALLASAFSAIALAFSTERLVSDLGLPTATAVLISLIGGTVGGLGFFVGGRMADEIGRRFTTIVALLAMIVGGIGVYNLGHPVALTAAIMVSTFGSFAYVPAAASHRVELFPTRFRSTAGAAGAYLAMLGSASGLLVGTALIDRIGLSETITALAVLVAVSILLTSLLPETRGQALDAVRPDR